MPQTVKRIGSLSPVRTRESTSNGQSAVCSNKKKTKTKKRTRPRSQPLRAWRGLTGGIARDAAISQPPISPGGQFGHYAFTLVSSSP